MTIATASVPLWSEGMLMCPQHMQQQDLYHEQHLHARLQALSAAPWGVTSVLFDTSALKAGTLQLSSFRGVLPDGTPTSFDALSPLRPPSRAIGPHFRAKLEALGVHLGLPLMREGVANYALSSDASAAQRFRGVVRRVFDLTLARNERELQVSEPALVLLFDGEPHKDHAILKIGEIVRDEAGGFTLADGFIPPALAISAAPNLVAELQDILSRGMTRRRKLAEERRGRSSAKIDLTIRELEKVLFLHALDRSLARLKHCSDTPETHPLPLYLALTELAGALMTVSSEGDPADLPSFQYSDLRATFAPLFAELRRLLSKEFDPVYIEVPLRIHEASSWVGEFRDERLLPCTTFVMIVEVEGDLVVASAEIPDITKISSLKRIAAIVRQQALGVPIRATFRPPPEIPIQPNQVYFIIDTSDQLWQELVSDRKIAFFLRAPYDPQRARAAFGAFLSAKERERLARLRFADHQRRFQIGHGALRAILGGYLGVDPAAADFTLGPRGKPYPSGRGPFFNLSHSDKLALIAVADHEIGVDQEKVRHLESLTAIARRHFSAFELAALDALDDAARQLAFYRCWTRKEAYIKALGVGLSMPLDTFDVSLGEQPEFLACRDGREEPEI